MIKNIKGVIKYRELLYEFARREIKAKYKQSIFGVGWVILQPVSMMIIFTIVFGRIAKIETDIAYPIFAYTGLLPWTLLSNSINKGVSSLTSNINLITKIYFPREIFPISATISALFDFLVGSSILVILLFIYNVDLSFMVLWVPLLVVIQTLLTMGIAFVLSSLNVFVRDVIPITTLGIQIWMYLTPVVYPAKLVPERFQFFVNLNPMAGVINSYKNVILFRQPPDPWLLYSFMVSLVVFLLGVKIFKKLEPKFADII